MSKNGGWTYGGCLVCVVSALVFLYLAVWVIRLAWG